MTLTSSDLMRSVKWGPISPIHVFVHTTVHAEMLILFMHVCIYIYIYTEIYRYVYFKHVEYIYIYMCVFLRWTFFLGCWALVSVPPPQVWCSPCSPWSNATPFLSNAYFMNLMSKNLMWITSDYIYPNRQTSIISLQFSWPVAIKKGATSVPQTAMSPRWTSTPLRVALQQRVQVPYIVKPPGMQP